MKRVLVTGGAKNLGATICKTLAQAGYSIVVHYRNSEEDANQVVEECLKYNVEADSIRGDFSSLASTEIFIKEYLARFQDTCHLINNVGEYAIGSSLETSVEQWYYLFQTNLHTPYLLIRSLLPSIKKEQGSIINIGISGLNAVRADTYSTAYDITKMGLLSLTKSLALEMGQHQVRVNMVSPGYLETSIDLPKDITHIPLGRTATRQEVAEFVLYLLSDKARYITGQNIEIAGGNRL